MIFKQLHTLLAFCTLSTCCIYAASDSTYADTDSAPPHLVIPKDVERIDEVQFEEQKT
jgi:hypothetical protein